MLMVCDLPIDKHTQSMTRKSFDLIFFNTNEDVMRRVLRILQALCWQPCSWPGSSTTARRLSTCRCSWTRPTLWSACSHLKLPPLFIQIASSKRFPALTPVTCLQSQPMWPTTLELLAVICNRTCRSTTPPARPCLTPLYCQRTTAGRTQSMRCGSTSR